MSGVVYKGISAVEVEADGALRLYRRRGLFGLLRRQDVYHPAGDRWVHVLLTREGTCTVVLAERGTAAS